MTGGDGGLTKVGVDGPAGDMNNDCLRSILFRRGSWLSTRSSEGLLDRGEYEEGGVNTGGVKSGLCEGV